MQIPVKKKYETKHTSNWKNMNHIVSIARTKRNCLHGKICLIYKRWVNFDYLFSNTGQFPSLATTSTVYINKI